MASVKKAGGDGDALFRLIREHGLKREFPLILSTIRAFSEGRVRIEQGQVGGQPGRRHYRLQPDPGN
jgi:phosphoribosylglycinamide formyltransferase-1